MFGASSRISQRMLRLPRYACAQRSYKVNPKADLCNTISQYCNHLAITQPTSTVCKQIAPVRLYSSETSSEDFENEEEKIDNTENPEKSEDEIKSKILDNALNFVAEHGWSRESLAMGAEQVGYSGVAEGMFARGGADLVLHFVRSSNEELLEYVKSQNALEPEEKPKTSEFIRNALEKRLRMLIPFMDVWPDAMALLLQPNVVVDATHELSKMVDDIWYYAGDVSTDFNWYTKRGLLAKLYVSTQVVMINDQSPDFTDTWEFLDRRMKDIATFGKITRNIQKFSQMGSDAAYAGFTVLRNVAGVGEKRR